MRLFSYPAAKSWSRNNPSSKGRRNLNALFHVPNAVCGLPSVVKRLCILFATALFCRSTQISTASGKRSAFPGERCNDASAHSYVLPHAGATFRKVESAERDVSRCSRYSKARCGINCTGLSAAVLPHAFRHTRTGTELKRELLELRFLVDHVLASNRIVLGDFHLARLSLAVLGRGIEMTRASRGLELDLIASAFRRGETP